MKKLLLLIVFLLTLVNPVNAQTKNIENLLFNLPDVIFEKIVTPDSYEVAYELKVRQPLDHFDPSKGFFSKEHFSHIKHLTDQLLLTRQDIVRKKIIYSKSLNC